MARILLVDDDVPVVHTEQMLFRAEGHDVVAVSESRQAAELLRSAEKFDLLVTDIRMEPVDGLELIRLARETRPEIGVIVISAYCSDDVVRQAREAGCAHYIKKPFHINEVLAAVRNALSQPRSGRRPTAP